MKKVVYICIYLFLAVTSPLLAQDISLFEQFNGRYNYLAIGNTLNPLENNGNTYCTILDNSSATLNMPANQTIVKAYLYWAGSGPGDTEVTLNSTTIEADNIYTVPYSSPNNGELTYFACYSDVTEFVNSNGNGLYELSDLDINSVLVSNPGYCGNRTNFGGWSIYIIYEDVSLPLNQISLFQGLQIINRNIGELEINLDNINVFDNLGAKIGFLAWEGDDALNFGESLSLNGNIISNPPLNLEDNAFNGTNSFTNSSDFYNIDLDVYDIENNISIGDTSAQIKLTTGDFDDNGDFRADLIILNNIITVLNSRLPDATIQLSTAALECNNRQIELDYTIFNVNSTAALPANTPIAFYIGDTLVAQSATSVVLNIGESESNFILINVPEEAGEIFEVVASVDDNGTMSGIVSETNETNNTNSISIELLVSPDVVTLPALLECNEGFERANYNLLDALQNTTIDPDTAQFFNTIEDLQNEIDSILNPSQFEKTESPQTIFIRVPDNPCYKIFQFDLVTENCPPIIPEGFSPNGDPSNDWFNIQGLYDIFINHELKIFNRHGVLIFEGNNDQPWTGYINRGLNGIGNKVPVGTYYYVLDLKDVNYRPMVGWVYVNY